jgi:hypothetical protein
MASSRDNPAGCRGLRQARDRRSCSSSSGEYGGRHGVSLANARSWPSRRQVGPVSSRTLPWRRPTTRSEFSAPDANARHKGSGTEGRRVGGEGCSRGYYGTLWSMTVSVRLPGSLQVRAGGARHQHASAKPDWGIYGDPCWDGWPAVSLDWPDSGVPRDNEQALSAVLEALGRARNGQDVLLGCGGGMGRTGTLLAAIAIACGVPPEQARAWVRSNYHPTAVETEEQHEWLTTVVARDHRILQSARKARQREVDVIDRTFREEMQLALDARDPLPRLAWAIPGQLAITQRPLRAPGPRT